MCELVWNAFDEDATLVSIRIETNGLGCVDLIHIEVLGDADHRLKFVQKSLQYQSDRDSGLAAMRAKYASYLPREALEAVANAADTDTEPTEDNPHDRSAKPRTD